MGESFLHGISEEFTFAVGLIHPGTRRYRVECIFVWNMNEDGTTQRRSLGGVFFILGGIDMEKIDLVKQEALNAIEACSTLEELNQVRVTYLGKKGPIQSLMSLMKGLSAEEKPAFGAEVNACKQAVAQVLEEKKMDLEEKAMNERLEKEKIDVTLPAAPLKTGTLHPLTLVTQEMEDLFICTTLNVQTFQQIIQQEICRIHSTLILKFF